MDNEEFWICQFTINKDVMNSYIWLGKNSNFCPGPLKWEPRQLYHAGDRRETQDLVEDLAEAEDLVWGERMSHKSTTILQQATSSDFTLA